MRVLIPLLLAAVLAACGQTGPLVPPDQAAMPPPEADATATPAPTPAAPTP
ncbi:LPS translocon maturation chaperone LptM [Sinimarinibacterium thermocellulolyticum]|uniref:Lipoprotein n=1 Tax=Sinimarinibacterium thermocellulolyticum TaxID=3170016 RepID=A0ABV2ACA8_9GAMM